MIITVYNDKGGAGKTPLVVAIASWAAARGQRVLIVDTDPQAALTTWADPNPSAIGFSVENVLLEPPSRRALAEAIYPCGDGWPEQISICPANSDLADYENLGDLERVHERLAYVLAHQLPTDVDLVVIDTPPTRGRLPKNALRAADRVVIPVQTEPSAANSVGKALGLIEQLGHWGEVGRPIGIVPTRYDRREGAAQRVLEDLTDAYGDLDDDHVLKRPVPLYPPIPKTTLFAAAAEEARSLNFARRSDAAEVFEWLDQHLPEMMR